MNLRDPQFWRDLKVGSTITLKDEETLTRQMEAGNGLEPIDQEINKIETIVEDDNLCEWLIFRFAGSQDLLLVKIVDQEVNLRIYSLIKDAPTGNRQDMIDAENHWLFLEPEDPEDFELNDLDFADCLLSSNLGFEAEYDYHNKYDGEFYGNHTSQPQESGIGVLLATVVEYLAEDEANCPNPELLLLELGPEEDINGGLIEFYEGRNINVMDLDVVRA